MVGVWQVAHNARAMVVVKWVEARDPQPPLPTPTPAQVYPHPRLPHPNTLPATATSSPPGHTICLVTVGVSLTRTVTI